MFRFATLPPPSLLLSAKFRTRFHSAIVVLVLVVVVVVVVFVVVVLIFFRIVRSLLKPCPHVNCAGIMRPVTETLGVLENLVGGGRDWGGLLQPVGQPERQL